MNSSVVEMVGFTSADMTRRSNGLNLLAGAAAAGIVVVMVCEIMLSSVSGGDVIPETVVDWFALLERQPFIGLRNLGLLNITSVVLGIPITFALYALLRRTYPDAAALAAISGYLGTAVFLATNRAFPMWSLSRAYAATTSGAEERALIAAGQAMLAVGSSHTPGTFLGFFLSSMAGILNAALMLGSPAFRKVTGYLGLVGMTLLFLFDSSVSFFPALWDTLMIVAMVGGLSSIMWYGFVARDLLTKRV